MGADAAGRAAACGRAATVEPIESPPADGSSRFPSIDPCTILTLPRPNLEDTGEGLSRPRRV